MINYQSHLMKNLTERGFLYQCTNIQGLDKTAEADTVTGYIGFDCTAPSLHIGSLVQIMMLRHLQKAGGRPIILIGGGTTKIGDPSDKDKARPILTPKQIKTNKLAMQGIFRKFIDFEGKQAALMIDNGDWLNKLRYITFLRDIGPHFTINRMITRESVKKRLDREQPMSFLEFNYSLLQAYDFLQLYRRHNCILQLGGSDQWGNIVSGVELARRLEGVECFGLTSPLITTASGSKMGKTAAGAIWLNANPELGTEYTTSPYDYWQFWRNTEDADVGNFLRLFTELPLEEITTLETLRGADINRAKIHLANAATSLLHGQTAAEQAEETARRTFIEGGIGDNLPTFTVNSLKHFSLVDAICLTGLAASKSQARRHIKSGALRVNNHPINDEYHLLNLADIQENGFIKISIGKKRHALIQLAA